MVLFFFPHAGGSAKSYSSFKRFLPKELTVVPMELSGRFTRSSEPLLDTVPDCVSDLIEKHSEYITGEYALFGYSMGCITLVEVLKRLADLKGYPLPCHVFIAAHEPLSRTEYPDNAELTDSWVRERTIQFGTVPDKVLNNKSFWRMYLPLYRADYSMIGRYRFEEFNKNFHIPATIFYSETDTPKEGMYLWKDIFVADCDFKQFEGAHFFIRQHHEQMAETIRSAMIRREKQ